VDEEGEESAELASESKLPSSLREGVDSEGFCTSIEEPGRSAGNIKLTQKVWMPVVEDFRAAKRKTVEWMKRHPEQFPPERFAEVSEWVMDLHIQRPPSEEEPDLSWRGTVVMSRFADGKPILRVGGGFLALYEKAPQRARFELARAVALVLAPCELKTMKLEHTWDSAFSCSQGFPRESCEIGSVSNGAWLVASAVASEIQSPGCQVRAVEKSGFLGCIQSKAVAQSSSGVDRQIASVPAKDDVPVGTQTFNDGYTSGSKPEAGDGR
jgi:hypothetical protein